MINYNISFYIRRSRVQEDGSAPLYARVRIDQEKYETSLGHNLHPYILENKLGTTHFSQSVILCFFTHSLA